MNNFFTAIKNKITRKFYSLRHSFLLKNKKLRTFLIRKYTQKHNQFYQKISYLARLDNQGIHPKRQIMKYEEFFIKNTNSNDNVIDLGCGDGFISYKLAEKVKNVLGVDVNAKNIFLAQRKFSRQNLKFMVVDATQLQTSEKFDKIILSNVLEHIEDRKVFLEKLHNLSDAILLRVPLIERDWLAFYKKQKGLEYKLNSTHFIEYTMAELNQELTASGWQLENYQINWGECWGIIKSSY